MRVIRYPVRLLSLLFTVALANRVVDPQASSNHFADLTKELADLREAFDDLKKKFGGSLLASGSPAKGREMSKKAARPSRPQEEKTGVAGKVGELNESASLSSSRRPKGTRGKWAPTTSLSPLSNENGNHTVVDGAEEGSNGNVVVRDRRQEVGGRRGRGKGGLARFVYEPPLSEGADGAEGADGLAGKPDSAGSFENTLKHSDDTTEDRVSQSMNLVRDLDLEIITSSEKKVKSDGGEGATAVIVSSRTQAPTFSSTPAHSRPYAQSSIFDSVPQPWVEPLKVGSAAVFRGGYSNPVTLCGVPFFVGTLKSFNFQNGYGFVECKDTFAIYNADVFIHKSQLPNPWRLGQLVKFGVRRNGNQQPQATDVLWLPMLPRKHEVDAKMKKRMALSRRHIGLLKSFSSKNGFGFVASEVVGQNHSCDVYLNYRQLPESGWVVPGLVIEFDIEENKNGQPQARHVDWAPVPYLRRFDPRAPVDSFIRALHYNELIGLEKALGFLRVEDTFGAIKMALQLQEASQKIDYVSFTLEHLGPPSNAIVAELSAMTQASLLIGLSKLLAAASLSLWGGRAAAAVGWCVAILDFGDKIRDENVALAVWKNIVIASNLRAYSSRPTLFRSLLGKLSNIWTPM